MTANQLQYASNEETARHNKAMEELNAQQNRLNEDHFNRMDSYNEQIGRARLELDKAQGDKKLQLQEELNQLEFLKANWLQEHQIRQDAINAEANKLRDKELDWVKIYQGKLIEQGWDKLQIEQLANDIKAKYNEYQHQYWEDIIDIQASQLANDQTKVLNDYRLRSEQNQIAWANAGIQKNYTSYLAGAAFANSVWEGVGTIGKLVPLPFMLFGGLNNGKKN